MKTQFVFDVHLRCAISMKLSTKRIQRHYPITDFFSKAAANFLANLLPGH